MYVVRFVTATGSVEEYFYHHLNDAEKHIDLFVDDDSNLYQKIQMVKDSPHGEQVIRTISFL